VLVICGDTDLGMMLLGRKGFFEMFIVSFYEKDLKIKLKRNKSN